MANEWQYGQDLEVDEIRTDETNRLEAPRATIVDVDMFGCVWMCGCGCGCEWATIVEVDEI